MTPQPFPYNEPVNSRYGAPMGRGDERGDLDHTGRLTLRRVPMVDGDYDGGGAYRGGGETPLFCAWAPDRSIVVYLRATGYRDAAAQLREDYEAAEIFGLGETLETESRVAPGVDHGLEALAERISAALS